MDIYLKNLLLQVAGIDVHLNLSINEFMSVKPGVDKLNIS